MLTFHHLVGLLGRVLLALCEDVLMGALIMVIVHWPDIICYKVNHFWRFFWEEESGG